KFSIERQIFNLVDVFANAAGIFTHRRVVVEVLRVVGRKHHSLGTNTLYCTAQRDGAAFESGHVEVKPIEVIAKRFRQFEAVRRPRDSLFVAGQPAAEMSEDKLKLRIALQDPAGDEPRDGHAEIELAREDNRELVIFQYIVDFR